MKRIVLVLCIVFSGALVSARAQNSNDWTKVEALPAKTRVLLETDRGKARCRLVSVNADSILCGKKRFAESDVRLVKRLRQGHSLAISLGIDAIMEGVFSFLIYASCADNGCPYWVAAAVAAGMIVSPLVGWYSDLAAETVYTRRIVARSPTL
jgi:hypothetical protein